MESERLVAELHLDLDNKADAIERLFCAALLSEGTKTTERVLKRYRDWKGTLGLDCRAAHGAKDGQGCEGCGVRSMRMIDQFACTDCRRPKLREAMKHRDYFIAPEECYYRCPCGRARTHSALNEPMARSDWNRRAQPTEGE